MVLKFMDNRKDDNYYIKNVIENIDIIISYTKGLSYDEFVGDLKNVDSVMFRLIQMVENIIRISSEYKKMHSNINWGQIIGFRNGIVHNYNKTDYSVVYEIISKDIYVLKENLDA